MTTAAASAPAAPAVPAPTLLKTDVLRRVRATPERRAAILAEFGRSGLSAAQFAHLAGINYSTFAQWVQRHRRSGRPGSRPAGRCACSCSKRLLPPARSHQPGPTNRCGSNCPVAV